MTGFVVGQTLYIDYFARQREIRLIAVTVEKVGRKWVTLSTGERFNAETMKLDGGTYTSHGDIYYSPEHHAETVLLEEAWRELRALTLPHHCPKNVSRADINLMIARLKGDGDE